MIPDRHSRRMRGVAEAIGDLVAEAQEDHSFWDHVEAEEDEADEWYDGSLLDDSAPPDDVGRWSFA